MNKTIKILFAAFFAFSVIFITSCENTLTITFTDRESKGSYSGKTNTETKILYNGKPGGAFLRTISAISGIGGDSFGSNDGVSESNSESNSERAQNGNSLKDTNSSQSKSNSQDTTDAFFDAEQIKFSMSQAGFENVNASADKDNSFSVGFSLSDFSDTNEISGKGKSEPLSSSGIFNHGQNGKPYLEISSEKLQSLYEKLPFEIQSYLDMLMAPSFTGEKMSDEEYLDLLASVYGQKLADEIKNSKINFLFVKTNANSTDNANNAKNANGTNAKRTKTTLSLLSILNTEGKITINSN